MSLLAWSMSVKVKTVIASKAKQSRIFEGSTNKIVASPAGLLSLNLTGTVIVNMSS